jgi:hypothetical protein
MTLPWEIAKEPVFRSPEGNQVVFPAPLHLDAQHFPTPSSPSWSYMSRRRAELIQRKVHDTLSEEDGGELEVLQKENLLQIYESLDSLSSLTDGWDSYSAPAPNQTAVGNAKAFAQEAQKLGFTPEFAEPSAMGGVGFTFFDANREVVVEFYNNGKAHALFVDEDQGTMDTKAVAPQVEGYRTIIGVIRTFIYG